jgi:hypothetical protein
VAQTAYVKASNTTQLLSFGQALALNTDGSTLAVGGIGDASNATGIDGNQTNNFAPNARAVYLY